MCIALVVMFSLPLLRSLGLCRAHNMLHVPPPHTSVLGTSTGWYLDSRASDTTPAQVAFNCCCLASRVLSRSLRSHALSKEACSVSTVMGRTQDCSAP